MKENGYGTWENNNAWETQGLRQTEEEHERQELKAARSHFSKLGGMFILGTIVIVAVQTLVSYLAFFLRPEWLMDGDISMILSMAPMYLIGMPVLVLLVRTVPADKVERHPIRAGKFIVAAIMCMGALYLGNIIGVIFTTIIGMLKGGIVQNHLANITQSCSLWTILIATVVCAPIVEEYVFRKLIVDRTVRYGQGTAVVLSGLMFALFHGNLNQFIYAFALGLILAFLYVKTGNLKITIAIHMVVNFMGGVVSTAVIRMFDLDEYLVLAQDMDISSMVAFVNENMAGILAYGALMIFVLANLIAGLVLFIVCLAKRRFSFAAGQVAIPRGKRFRTVILNLGMLLYIIFWIANIIYQLFM